MQTIIYKIGYYFFKVYFIIFHRCEIRGKSNRPESGSLIIIANHISFSDPPLVGTVMKRPVHFLAKIELFKNPLAGWILRKIGVIPIKRGKADLKAIRKAFKVLKEQKILGVFPEGTRHKHGKLGEAQAGSILLALKSKAPILPIAIKYKNDKSKKTQVSIGKPFTLDQYYNKKLDQKQKQKVGKIMMKKIKNELVNLN